MPRPSWKAKLPSPVQNIVRVVCSVCNRTWAVYEGTLPRMWVVKHDAVVCDLPSCRRAAGVALPQGRQAALNR